MTEAELRIRQQSRLAITVRDPNTDVYPAAADEPNTYWIVFVDGEFTAVQGNQAHTLSARQTLTKARALAHNLIDGPGAYVAENTLIEVTWHSRHWWFYYGAEEPSTSSGSSGSSGSSASSGAPAEKCWVGVDADGIHVHKTPLSFVTEANPAAAYNTIRSNCGLSFDDAGHLVGWYDGSNAWTSPWGLPAP
jgi:hypothetical protein